MRRISSRVKVYNTMSSFFKVISHRKYTDQLESKRKRQISIKPLVWIMTVLHFLSGLNLYVILKYVLWGIEGPRPVLHSFEGEPWMGACKLLASMMSRTWATTGHYAWRRQLILFRLCACRPPSVDEVAKRIVHPGSDATGLPTSVEWFLGKFLIVEQLQHS